MSTVLQDACARAWADLLSNPAQSVAHASFKQGVHPKTMGQYISSRHPGQLQAIRAKQGLPLRFPPGSLICGLCGQPMAYPEARLNGKPVKAVHAATGRRRCGPKAV